MIHRLGALTSILVLAAATMSPAPAPTAQDEALPPPVVTFAGHDSRIAERRFVRIRDRAAWSALWAEHRGDAIEKNASGWPNPPLIDFERWMVVGCFRGDAWNANGEYVQSIARRGDEILVRWDAATFQTMGPEPDGGGIRVRTFGLWVVPRTDRAIVLEENVQGLIGEPPKWKEQHRFEAIAP